MAVLVIQTQSHKCNAGHRADEWHIMAERGARFSGTNLEKLVLEGDINVGDVVDASMTYM